MQTDRGNVCECFQHRQPACVDSRLAVRLDVLPSDNHSRIAGQNQTGNRVRQPNGQFEVQARFQLWISDNLRQIRRIGGTLQRIKQFREIESPVALAIFQMQVDFGGRLSLACNGNHIDKPDLGRSVDLRRGNEHLNASGEIF